MSCDVCGLNFPSENLIICQAEAGPDLSGGLRDDSKMLTRFHVCHHCWATPEIAIRQQLHLILEKGNCAPPAG